MVAGSRQLGLGGRRGRAPLGPDPFSNRVVHLSMIDRQFWGRRTGCIPMLLPSQGVQLSARWSQNRTTTVNR